MTVTDKPKTPTRLVAQVVGANGARVTFNAPESNGSPITEYRLYDQTGRQVATCAVNVCDVAGLSDGATYSFTAVAVNKEGESERSGASNTITISGVPGRPGTPQPTAGNAAISVSWTAPVDNGSPITGYIATATTATGDAGHCETTGVTSCVIQGLKNGQTYTVTVRARNAKGESPASSGAQATPKAPIQPPDKPVISKAAAKQVATSMVVDVEWTLGKSGTSGWGTTTLRVGNQTVTVAGGETSRRVPVTPGTTVDVSVTVTNLQGESKTSDTRTVTIPALAKVPTPDAPGLHTPPNNDVGKIRVTNARLREGNGYKAANLELFYADTPEKCKAPGNPVHFNNGDQADFDIGPLTPGATVTFYFCQGSKKGDDTYEWSGTVAVTGVVGNGQRSRDDDDDPIPTFEVQATARYVRPNSWGVAASWTNPSGVEITKTTIWIDGLKGSTEQSWAGPLTQWWAEDLQPGHEYTIVVQVIGKNGQHREVKTTVKTGDLADNVKATFEGETTCPNGQPCGSMTLRAVNASNFQSGVTLVCRVKTGRPAAITEFRFSRDNPQSTGILTEAVTGPELLAKPPVVDCRAE